VPSRKKQVGTARSHAIGTANGSRRGVEAQKRRREKRLSDPRVQQALEDARRNQAWLDAEAAKVPVGPGRPKAEWVKDPLYDVAREVTDEVLGAGTYAEVNAGSLNPGVQAAIAQSSRQWAMTDVIDLLDQGYQVPHVARRTGYDIDVVRALAVDLFGEDE
jgi:hypothetical protein